ncbi:MAG: methylaspartate ammonia-lyase [Patescibacteria group bacterium]
MRIDDCVFSPGLTGFFFDDQRAIKSGAEPDGLAYRGVPLTPGFDAIRIAGESVSVQLILEDGSIAHGDCAAVQYSGAGGRDPVFLAREYLPLLEEEVAPRLRGRELLAFRPLAGEIDGLCDARGRRLHTAIRYGVTQALLDACAKAQRRLMCEVIAAEYGIEPALEPVHIFAQSGDDRYLNADKMIIKGVDVLPHGLINNVHTKLGDNGEILLDYVAWLKKRVGELGGRGYLPIFHLDVYGTIGLAFHHDLDRIADYLRRLQEAAAPHLLRIEGPLDMENRDEQIAVFAALRRLLRAKRIPVEIVADEWCNSCEDLRAFADAEAVDMVQVKTPVLGGINNAIEAVLYCKKRGVGAYLGGTCNETDRSAQVSVHIALATRPDQMLAKPGMGVDEGLSIVRNEMARALAILSKRGANSAS